MNKTPEYNKIYVAAYFKAMGLREPIFEIRHIPGRKHALDLAWPEKKVGIEVQGGIWNGGKHGRGAGIRKDMEKRNLQILNGWRVLEVEPRELCTVATVEMVRKCLEG